MCPFLDYNTKISQVVAGGISSALRNNMNGHRYSIFIVSVKGYPNKSCELTGNVRYAVSNWGNSKSSSRQNEQNEMKHESWSTSSSYWIVASKDRVNADCVGNATLRNP